MKSLRQRLSEQMVAVHSIPPGLADCHVAAMSNLEVRERYLGYLRKKLSEKMSAALEGLEAAQ